MGPCVHAEYRFNFDGAKSELLIPINISSCTVCSRARDDIFSNNLPQSGGMRCNVYKVYRVRLSGGIRSEVC